MTKKTYEPAPEVAAELRERWETMLRVMRGELTVSDGARTLGMSRNHFQTLLHRMQKGMLAGLAPGEPGRPGKPQREAELERENEKLKRELERLRGRTEMIDRLLGVASGVIRGRVEAGGRARESRPKGSGDDDDPEGVELAMKVEAERALREAGLRAPLSCAMFGVSAATLRRWRRRVAALDAAARRVSTPPLAAELAARVVALVRALGGLVGADSLRHAVPGVSRRQAATLKRETLTAMERERVAAAARVVVTAPGIVRGMDAMHVRTSAGPRWPLIVADAAVPCRTSVLVAEHYDEHAVARVLERDFAQHGPPLVLRADRAKAHETPAVLDVLRRHGVLLLHGPPHHPRYYGQLERQNREHRAWLDAQGEVEADTLEETCWTMLDALNSQWPRRSLGWKTSLELWNARPAVHVDRAALRAEVEDRAARIRRRAEGRAAVAAMAERLAIEQALTNLGLLRLEAGGRC